MQAVGALLVMSLPETAPRLDLRGQNLFDRGMPHAATRLQRLEFLLASTKRVQRLKRT